MVFADARAHAHAQKTARADGLERLHALITCALRVHPRIQKRPDALQTVRLRHAEERASGNAAKKQFHLRRVLHVRAKQHDERRPQNDHRRPHVRLNLYQRSHRRNHINLVMQKIAPHSVLHAPRDIIRFQKDRGRFRKLGRLEMEAADGKPALGAVDLDAGEKNGNQKGEHQTESQFPAFHQMMIVDDVADEKADDAHRQIDSLFADEKIRIVVIRARDHETGAENIERADDQQHHRDGENRLVIADPKAPLGCSLIPRVRFVHWFPPPSRLFSFPAISGTSPRTACPTPLFHASVQRNTTAPAALFRISR